MSETDRTHLIENIVGSLKPVRRDVNIINLNLYRFKREY